jgi:dihydrofolate reductase
MNAHAQQRPQVAVFLAVSLDGFIAGPGDSLDWLAPYQGGDDYGYAGFAAGIDAIVMGRRTYDVARGFRPWPYAGRRVVVLTHRLLPADHAAAHGLRTHAGALDALWPALAADGVRHVYLDGGAAVRQGLREGCVDELTLSLIPCVLGAGVPLFGEPLPGSQWTLLRSRAAARGVVQSVYRRTSLEPAAG